MQGRAAIADDMAAYRRGVVLGLTMAEIMLLLVFCLLIATSVVFTRYKAQNLDLQSKLTALNTQVSELENEQKTLRELLDKLRENSGPPEKIADNWENLSTDLRFAKQIDQAGLPRDELLKQAAELKELLPSLTSGVTAEKIFASLQEVETLEKAKASQKLSAVSIEELIRLAKAAQDREQSSTGEHDWPPIIPLSEADGYSFAVGKADLTPDFERRKLALVDQVADLISRYKVDVIEVVGHTDEQPMGANRSNLDDDLIAALTGKVPIGLLTPADNAGLGMARAVSVASVLLADPRLKGIKIVPFSAGQLVLPGDNLSNGSAKGDLKERRRIEIRMRRSAPIAHR